jgi:integrase
LVEYLDEYLDKAGIRLEKDGPIFRSFTGKSKSMSLKPLSRIDVYEIVRRRTQAAGIDGRFSCHSFRATGITTYLENGGSLELAQWIAGHSDSRTTKLYDRRGQRARLEDLERVRY